MGLVAGTEPATAQTAAKTSKDVLLGEANTATATTSITMSASGDSAVAGVDTSPDGGYGVSGTSTNGTGVYGASASSGNTVGPGPAGVAGYGMTSDAIGVEAVNSSNGVALSVEGKATFSTSASDGLVVSMAPAMTGDPLQVENSSSESLLSLVPVNSGHDLTLQLGNSDGVTSVVLDPFFLPFLAAPRRTRPAASTLQMPLDPPGRRYGPPPTSTTPELSKPPQPSTP